MTDKNSRLNRLHPYCQGCIYATAVGGDQICQYILIVRHRRPCPPGEGCTVRVLRPRRRRGADRR